MFTRTFLSGDGNDLGKNFHISVLYLTEALSHGIEPTVAHLPIPRDVFHLLGLPEKVFRIVDLVVDVEVLQALQLLDLGIIVPLSKCFLTNLAFELFHSCQLFEYILLTHLLRGQPLALRNIVFISLDYVVFI